MTATNEQVHTRTVILQQARAQFLQRGYHKTTMRSIAAAAGISTGPLYFHFSNKADVFVHICSEALDAIIADCRRAAAQNQRAGLRLRDIYYAYKAFYYREPQMFEIMHVANNPLMALDLPQPVTIALQQKTQVLIAIMEEVIRQGIARRELRPVEPCVLALYLYSAAEGIFLSHSTGMLERNGISLDKMIDNAIELIGVGIVELTETSS